MTRRFSYSSICLLVLTVSTHCVAKHWIRINQLGYLPGSVKVAVYMSQEEVRPESFQLRHALTEAVVYEGKPKPYTAADWGMKSAYRLDLSDYKQTGGYYLQLGDTKSPCFRIAGDVYEGTADFLLKYMRQQRCAYNPDLKGTCHLHDGIIVDHPQKTGQRIDVTGGWHDASDYLQYLSTSAHATYQMLFAYLHNPAAFGDNYDARGHVGKNGIPDILDEARWGLEWLVKMNPAYGEMYNQIADDRDHVGYRLSTQDTADYGLGKSRPVYYITGKPQGLGQHKNRTTGVSSSAAKFASAFALGTQIMAEYDPVWARKLGAKAREAYEFALTDLGVCQTACYLSPYFYEEENYVDDLELAACELHRLSGQERYLEEAKRWADVEPVSPWMALGQARHYQFYPFVNLGHVYLAQTQAACAEYLRQGLALIMQRAKEDPFLNGIPFIWCSNNLVAGALTQTRSYQRITGDTTYQEMEAALRDWLFGCNPWGTSMICGLPAGGDSPQMPHSSITHLRHETTYGGLVDGPVYKSIFQSLRGIHLRDADEYAPFQHGKAVYHDDIGDYSSNEPTMDGTASLSFYLSSMESRGHGNEPECFKDKAGAIIRINPTAKGVYLAFTADDKAEGGETILQVLRENDINASFFFTGRFLRDARFVGFIQSVKRDGHYIGPHSDQHLLYCDWDEHDKLLVSRQTFEQDLRQNYQALRGFGIDVPHAPWFIPPYEWYNPAIVDWSRALGLSVVSFTPGIRTNADYTTPDMKNYMSSDDIVSSVFRFEKESEDGLNGCIMLFHPGTDAARKDKLYRRLPEIIQRLKRMHYGFYRL